MPGTRREISWSCRSGAEARRAGPVTEGEREVSRRLYSSRSRLFRCKLLPGAASNLGIYVTTQEQNALFDEWLKAHAAVLHHVANGFADSADRDDLMQELLLAVWRSVPAFRGTSKVSTFLYRVAHNAALTWRRGQIGYRNRVDRFEATAAAASEPPSSGRGAAGTSEALLHIYAAIRRLAPVDRSLILLQLDGVDHAEIGSIHGLTENNVAVRLNRIRQKLMQILQPVTHELR